MAPKQGDQSFTFETVAVILCCMLKSGTTLGNTHYEMMSKLDGSRGKDAFQHQFRKVKARAQELLEKLENDPSVAVGVKPRSNRKKQTDSITKEPQTGPKNKAKNSPSTDSTPSGQEKPCKPVPKKRAQGEQDDSDYPSKRIKGEYASDGEDLY